MQFNVAGDRRVGRMTYVPDPRNYQQLHPVGKYGGFNCTAEGAAFRVDAHTRGAIRTTGESVRAHSDEPIPDRTSPGLNLLQVDAAVRDITMGQVNFDTRVQGRSLSRAELKFRIRDDRFCGLSVNRGIFVARGFLSGFSGAHDVTLFVRDTDWDQPLLFDPLVPSITRVSWDVAFDAAESLTGGYIYAQLTRDLTPDYHWVLHPVKPATIRAFYRFKVENGRVVGMVKRWTRGTDVRCTPPRYYPGANGQKGRQLVQLVAPGQHRDGWYVNARYAEELNP